jgi:uncharacterized RDD family membrane protein YckC
VNPVAAPPNWYPDPDGSGGLRWWDGTSWTWYRTPPPGAVAGPAGAWVAPTWKGQRLGRPPRGPGALADPGRRLGARLLDILVLLPAFAVLLIATLLVAAPHFGPLFPEFPQISETPQPQPTPGFVWLYLVVSGCALAMSLVMVVYETVLVAVYGRTLGMRWLRIRVLGTDGVPIGWGRAFVRAIVYWLFSLLGWIGVLNVLWCLWDADRQCVHDKAADTIVVNDPADVAAGPTVGMPARGR